MDMMTKSLLGKLRRAVPAVAAIVVVTIATGCSAGCSASVSIGHKKTGGTYSGHGISLTVPDGWVQSASSATAETGNEIWSQGFGPVSSVDFVAVTAYATNVAVTQKNAEKYAPKVTVAVKRLFESAGGTLLSGPKSATIGDMVGYRFETTFPAESGETLDGDVLMVWNGHTEYFFNCQYQANGSRKAEIKRGCKTIESTFKLA